MTRILIALFLLDSLGLHAQNDLTVFSEKGEKFYLYINNEQVNDTAKSEVTIRPTLDRVINVKIRFEGGQFEEVTKIGLQLFNLETADRYHTTRLKLYFAKNRYRLKVEERKSKLERSVSLPGLPRF